MKKGLIVLIIVVVIIIIAVASILGTYNGMVALRENVDTSFSNIDTQLQRRADLIPNLVNTVKGYASHESEIIANVSNARAKLAGAQTVAEKANANSELTNAVGRLLAIAENYPDLKANANFIQLSDELAGTENRIAVSRLDYNNAVKAYNTKLKKFPANIFANMFGFEPAEYFEAQQGAAEVPQVSFE